MPWKPTPPSSTVVMHLLRRQCRDVLPQRLPGKSTFANDAHKTEIDDYWLHLYVMLSRATRLEDLLLVRTPSRREGAAQLATELGLQRFLRD